MRIDKVYIEDFKNLKKFSIDIDESSMNTVFLGQNATGKSNFLEALVLIFKHLDLSTEQKRKYPEFNYKIKYQCRERHIEIEYTSKSYQILVDDEKPSFNHFFSKEGRNKYLPKYIFSYYSGVSDRLDRIFWEHQNKFYNKIKSANYDKTDLDDLRRLFYVKQIHSFFVLLAFFSLPRMESKSKDFLNNTLGIEDLESVLFVLKEPSWNGKGDERFFGAEGLVREFLTILWEYSLAPIYHGEKILIDFRGSREYRNRLYLYISNKKKLKAFAKKYFEFNNEKPSNTFLFKALESTYISEMLEEVKVIVKKKVDGKVTFKELSEGEQQLLTVIGLLIFTKEEESLILLDEPDTHLNPLWKWEYLSFLKKLVKSSDKEGEKDEEDTTTQILINTHDPLVIGSMTKSQVRIFKKGEGKELNYAVEPNVDPKGLGVAGILTSELFGLPTILDKETQSELNRKRFLQGRLMRQDLSAEDYQEYQKLKAKLEKLGFYEEVEDYWFKQYLAEMSKLDIFQKVEFSKEEEEILLRSSKKAVEKIKKLMENKENEV